MGDHLRHECHGRGLAKRMEPVDLHFRLGLVIHGGGEVSPVMHFCFPYHLSTGMDKGSVRLMVNTGPTNFSLVTGMNKGSVYQHVCFLLCM